MTILSCELHSQIYVITLLSLVIPGRETDYSRFLKKEGQELLILALSSLEAAMEFLEDGSIEFQMLTLLHDNSERFLMLCEQISKKGSEQTSLKQVLDQRCTEITAFEEECGKVCSFIRTCSVIKQGKKKSLLPGIFYLSCCI